MTNPEIIYDTEKASQLIITLFKAFDKKPDSELAEIYLNRLKNLDIRELEHRITVAIDRCKFFPRVSEILEIKTPLQEAREADFLLRFRKQARNVYLKSADPDVFTVKEYIGKSRIENAHITDWPKIEEKALSLFRLIKSGNIKPVSSQKQLGQSIKTNFLKEISHD